MEEKERCALKKKTPLTVVSDLFLDLVADFGAQFPVCLYMDVLGYRIRPITLPLKLVIFLMCIDIYNSNLFLGQFVFSHGIPLLNNTLYVMFN